MKFLVKIFLVLLLLYSNFLYSNFCNAQPITWQRIYGLNDNRTGTCGIQTYDGGYLFISADPGTKIIKVDQYGIIVWEKFYQVGAQDKVIQTSDSGYALCGTGGNESRGGILKVRNNGDSVWYREYGTTSNFRLWSIIEYLNGGFVACGNKNNDVYIIRVDSSGSKTWETIITNKFGVGYRALDLLCDPNYNIAVTGGPDAGSLRRDVPLFKINPNGVVYLKKFISTEPISEAGERILRSYDGKYMISGTAINHSGIPVVNSHVTKLDTNGELIYQRYFVDQTFFIAKSSDSNSYVLTGRK